MPAFVNSNVGSLAGRRGDERTRVCPCSSKYLRNASRISSPVIIDSSLSRLVLIHRLHRFRLVFCVIGGYERSNLFTDEIKRKTAPQQMIEQALGLSAILRLSAYAQSLCDCLVDQLLFRSLGVNHFERLDRKSVV